MWNFRVGWARCFCNRNSIPSNVIRISLKTSRFLWVAWENKALGTLEIHGPELLCVRQHHGLWIDPSSKVLPDRSFTSTKQYRERRLALIKLSIKQLQFSSAKTLLESRALCRSSLLDAVVLNDSQCVMTSTISGAKCTSSSDFWWPYLQQSERTPTVSFHYDYSNRKHRSKVHPNSPSISSTTATAFAQRALSKTASKLSSHVGDESRYIQLNRH